jgi:hypothetical protein
MAPPGIPPLPQPTPLRVHEVDGDGQMAAGQLRRARDDGVDLGVAGCGEWITRLLYDRGTGDYAKPGYQRDVIADRVCERVAHISRFRRTRRRHKRQ